MTRAKIRDTYTPWLYLASAAIVSEDGSYPSRQIVDQIQKITGFDSLKSLQHLVRKYERGCLPKNLQNRFARLFRIENHPELCGAPINVSGGRGRTYQLPFPFKPRRLRKMTISIEEFGVSAKRSSLEIWFRLGIELPDLLVPASVTERNFCMLIESAECFAESGSHEREVIVEWATFHGIPKTFARSSGFLRELESEISDTIERLMTVGLEQALLQVDENLYIEVEDHEWGLVGSK